MTSSRSSRARPMLILAVGSLCISFAAVFVKLIGHPGGMGPTPIGLWRTFFGAAALLTAAAATGQRLAMGRAFHLWSPVAGFVFYLDLFFWHRSIVWSGAGLSTMLAATQVFVVATLSWFLYRERLSLKFFAAAIAGIVGVALLVGVGSDIDLSGLYLAGVGFGLATGLAYGAYLVIMRYIGHRKDKPEFAVFVGWTSLWTAFFMLVSCLIEGVTFLPPDTYSWLISAALGVTVQAAGWWFITTSIPKLEGWRGSLILVGQPVLTTIWGYLFFAEILTALQILGAVITVTAIYVGSVLRSSH